MVHKRPVGRSSFQPDLPVVLTIAMIVLLWIAGGASRADTMGQVVVRAGCWAILAATILMGPRPTFTDVRPVVFLLITAIVLPLVQLVPLPPAWWKAMPGREILLVPGQPAPWRPWTITPGATRNALASLVVPLTMLIVLAQDSERLRRWMPSILLTMIGAAVLLGLLQVSDGGFNNPLLNDTTGIASSIFANRNHFALFLAIGCLVAPVWAFMDHEAMRWRVPLSGGLVLLFVMTILATGSRSGLLLGALALILALALVARRLRRHLRGMPRWFFPVLLGITVLVIGGFVALSFAVDRADAINRFIHLEGKDDMRSRALPTVMSMIATYMPFGSGYGGFDPVFRIHEPFGLLKITYFNQAHNDYLGIAVDGGIVGIASLCAGMIWWLVSSIRVWRMKGDDGVLMARLGSAIVFLVLVASLTDYPARTPTIMAVLVMAACWLSRGMRGSSQNALRS